jgi:arylsulfatase A-like enzyme
VLPETELELEGVPCGDDTGLGSVWEANLRMPAVARFPGQIPPNSDTDVLISTLDVIPTFLSWIGRSEPNNLDGKDMSHFLRGEQTDAEQPRILYFWRDGFGSGPLPAPYGRFDVAAVSRQHSEIARHTEALTSSPSYITQVKYGKLKAWFWTKSAHYNADVEAYHDPPLLFDVLSDPAESTPLDPAQYQEEIQFIKDMVENHKRSLDGSIPLCLDADPKYLPCVDRATGCRTSNQEMQ